mmetsp:Transcript_3392/g.9556  ORF Transcript_3392/g.9556 Transcript_3392/m.9556 type:complete len:354 (-) Transcript_3392:230-1291(-)
MNACCTRPLKNRAGPETAQNGAAKQAFCLVEEFLRSNGNVVVLPGLTVQGRALLHKHESSQAQLRSRPPERKDPFCKVLIERLLANGALPFGHGFALLALHEVLLPQTPLSLLPFAREHLGLRANLAEPPLGLHLRFSRPLHRRHRRHGPCLCLHRLHHLPACAGGAAFSGFLAVRAPDGPHLLRPLVRLLHVVQVHVVREVARRHHARRGAALARVGHVLGVELLHLVGRRALVRVPACPLAVHPVADVVLPLRLEVRCRLLLQPIHARVRPVARLNRSKLGAGLGLEDLGEQPRHLRLLHRTFHLYCTSGPGAPEALVEVAALGHLPLGLGVLEALQDVEAVCASPGIDAR